MNRRTFLKCVGGMFAGVVGTGLASISKPKKIKSDWHAPAGIATINAEGEVVIRPDVFNSSFGKTYHFDTKPQQLRFEMKAIISEALHHYTYEPLCDTTIQAMADRIDSNMSRCVDKRLIYSNDSYCVKTMLPSELKKDAAVIDVFAQPVRSTEYITIKITIDPYSEASIRVQG